MESSIALDIMEASIYVDVLTIIGVKLMTMMITNADKFDTWVGTAFLTYVVADLLTAARIAAWPGC